MKASLGWIILAALVGAALMWAYDHQDLIRNRQRISAANQVVGGLQTLFGGA